MKKLPYLLVLSGLVSVPLAVSAEGSPITGNVGLYSDYAFRGVSQQQATPPFRVASTTLIPAVSIWAPGHRTWKPET